MAEVEEDLVLLDEDAPAAVPPPPPAPLVDVQLSPEERKHQVALARRRERDARTRAAKRAAAASLPTVHEVVELDSPSEAEEPTTDPWDAERERGEEPDAALIAARQARLDVLTTEVAQLEMREQTEEAAKLRARIDALESALYGFVPPAVPAQSEVPAVFADPVPLDILGEPVRSAEDERRRAERNARRRARRAAAATAAAAKREREAAALPAGEEGGGGAEVAAVAALAEATVEAERQRAASEQPAGGVPPQTVEAPEAEAPVPPRTGEPMLQTGEVPGPAPTAPVDVEPRRRRTAKRAAREQPPQPVPNIGETVGPEPPTSAVEVESFAEQWISLGLREHAVARAAALWVREDFRPRAEFTMPWDLQLAAWLRGQLGAIGRTAGDPLHEYTWLERLPSVERTAARFRVQPIEHTLLEVPPRVLVMHGLFATRDIEPNTLVDAYYGEVDLWERNPTRGAYVFVYAVQHTDEGFDPDDSADDVMRTTQVRVDAQRSGHLVRFVNQACRRAGAGDAPGAANARFDVAIMAHPARSAPGLPGGMPFPVLSTTRRVLAGEQLLVRYNEERADPGYDCMFCGTRCALKGTTDAPAAAAAAKRPRPPPTSDSEACTPAATTDSAATPVALEPTPVVPDSAASVPAVAAETPRVDTGAAAADAIATPSVPLSSESTGGATEAKAAALADAVAAVHL